MPKTYIKSGGSWQEIKSIYLKTNDLWTNIKNAYLKVAGAWQLVFTASVPSIAHVVEISKGTASTTTGLITLTGTNYHWNDLGAGTLTYYFEWSTDAGVTWSTINTGSILNPSTGSSNTKTYEVKLTDAWENLDNLYRFRVYANNGTNFANSTVSDANAVTISTPRNITLTATSATVEGQVELNFTAPLYANSYKIKQVYTDVTPNVTTYIYKTTAGPFNITGLVVEGNYKFSITPYTSTTLYNNVTIGYPGYESNIETIKVYKEALPVNQILPSISGSGTTMTGNVGTWLPAATSYDVRFIRVDINGLETIITPIAPTPPATTTTYTTSTMGTYYFEARGLNSKGAGNPYVRSTTFYEIMQAPVNLTAPTISGTLNEGQTLTVSNGTWAYGPDSYSYQWQSSTNNSTWSNISGATSNSYTIPSGYGSSPGPYIRAYVIATNNGGSSSPAYAASKTIIPPSPVNTTAPHLTNSGTTVTSTAGTWSNSPTSYTYRWYRDDLAPGSAGNPLRTFGPTTNTTDSYVGSASYQFGIYTEVTATNAGGSAVAYSDNSITLYVAPTPVPTLPAPQNTVAPHMTNVGTNMTVTAGSWNYSPTTYSYYWYRDDIPEGTANSLLRSNANTTNTTDSYNGSASAQWNYYVKVVATNASGSTTIYSDNSIYLYSAPTPAPAAPVPTPTASAPVNTVAPHMTNSGTAMTVTAGSWNYNPTSYVYRWYRDDLAPTSNGNPLRTSSVTTSTTDTFTGSSSAQWNYYVSVTATNSVGSTLAYSDNSIYLYAAPSPVPTAPVPAPTAPVPAPTAPVPAPTAPVPAPTAPVPAPTAPVPAPTAPVPAPTAPSPAPTPVAVQNRNCTSTDYRTGMCNSNSGCDNSGCASGTVCSGGTNRRGSGCL